MGVGTNSCGDGVSEDVGAGGSILGGTSELASGEDLIFLV